MPVFRPSCGQPATPVPPHRDARGSPPPPVSVLAYRKGVARNTESLKLAALATVAIRGLEVVATRPPQLATSDYRYCGVLDSRGRHWVVQAPLHASAAAALDAEVRILAELERAIQQDLLTFNVALAEGFAPMDNGWKAMAYRELPGRPLDLDDLTPGPGPTVSLATVLAQIHELHPSTIEDAGAPVYDADSYRRRRLAELDDAARTTRVPPVLLARWERALEDVGLWSFGAVPVHGDLAPENVRVSNGDTVAILNWSNAHVGDPAEDLAWLYAAAPEESLDTLDEAYAQGRSIIPDPHIGARATLYSELAVARWLLHGVRIEDQTIVTDAETMLHTLTRQVADAGPIGQALAAPAVDIPEESAAPILLLDSEYASWQVSGSIRVEDADTSATAATATTAYSAGTPGPAGPAEDGDSVDGDPEGDSPAEWRSPALP